MALILQLTVELIHPHLSAHPPPFEHQVSLLSIVRRGTIIDQWILKPSNRAEIRSGFNWRQAALPSQLDTCLK